MLLRLLRLLRFFIDALAFLYSRDFKLLILSSGPFQLTLSHWYDLTVLCPALLKGIWWWAYAGGILGVY